MRHAAILLALTLLPLAAACSDDDPVAPQDHAVGLYVLATVDGEALPYTFSPAPFVMQIRAGSIRLHDDGTFTESVTFRLESTDTGQVTEETETHDGTWRLDGETLELTSETMGVSYADATLTDGTLSYTVTGIFSFDLRFEREEA